MLITLDPRVTPLSAVERVRSGALVEALLPNGVTEELLAKYDLAIFFARAAKVYLVGFTDPDMPDHDRFLFASPVAAGDRGKRLWCVIASHHEQQTLTKGEVYGQIREGVFRDHVKDFASITMAANVLRTDGISLPPARVLKHAVLLNNYDASVLALMPAKLNFQRLHDQLNHATRWRQENPDEADLPLDLVLRLDGLGPVLDRGAILKSTINDLA